MNKFGSQTSTYNRLVTVFVAIGSMVSIRNVFSHLESKGSDPLFPTRPMATVLPSSAVLSANQDGIVTSIFPQRVNLATQLSQHPPSRLPMVSSVAVVQSAPCS